MTEEMAIPHAFQLSAELVFHEFQQQGHENLKTYGDLFSVSFTGATGSEWKISGHAQADRKIDDLPPFCFKITFNGWPAGLIDPRGGVIAAGTAANEDVFIRDIQTELAQRGLEI